MRIKIWHKISPQYNLAVNTKARVTQHYIEDGNYLLGETVKIGNRESHQSAGKIEGARISLEEEAAVK